MSTKDSRLAMTEELPSERQIFSNARRLIGKSRSDYLENACGENAMLRSRVDKLLDSFEEQDIDLIDRAYRSVLRDIHGSNETLREDSQFTFDEISHLFEAGSGDSIGRIDHYEIKEMIGRGAFGVVFKAFDTKLARSVAIKILAPTLACSLGFRERFLQEARASAAIRHDNVVRIHAVEDAPFPFIVMELVNGETLRSHVQDHGPLATEETFDLGIQIIKGLAAAHQKGIVHLDVKPANILVEELPNGKKIAKLTDFGLALVVDGQGEAVPETLLGTPAYMAPEHAKGEGVDQRADLFSFGSVLFSMCSGQAAFGGSETISVLRGIVENKRAEIPEGVEVSRRLVNLIDRLHSTLPENRYDSAEEVLTDLLRLSRSHSIRRKSTSLAPMIALVGIVVMSALTIFGAKLFSSETTDASAAMTSISNNESMAAPVKEATWSDARQQLIDVTSQIEKLDEKFKGNDCNYEIRDGKVLHVRMPFANDLSPLANLKDVEHLFLEPPGPEREVPVGIEFVSEMKKLRILKLQSFPTKNLEPLRGLQLKKLDLWYSRMNAKAYPAPVDLDPLKGMPLNWLNCGGCGIESLKPLEGMKLESLCLNFSRPFSDLSPVKGMPLYTLQISNTKVCDLSPLVGTPLKILEASNSKVRDLSPLVGMPLEELYIKGLEIDDLEVLKKCHIKALWIDHAADHESLIKSMQGLERINGVLLDDFFENQEQIRYE